MQNNFDITSDNAELILTVKEIFPSGIILQMFGTDQAFRMVSIDITETRKGVDSKIVAGYLPAIYPITITLEAFNPSRLSLSTLWKARAKNKNLHC